MATMTLKNVPEGLVKTLKEQATRNRRSLNQEAISRLELSLATRQVSGPEKVEAMKRIQRRLAGLPPLTDAFLARAKNAGRL